ncbi:MAG: DUF3078 domain-containing protein [Bacteroidales bacterium]|mgnify:CR=1 FL=1|nr:DUF3078 domain-containing protein [Bacteroidales bacterium]
MKTKIYFLILAMLAFITTMYSQEVKELVTTTSEVTKKIDTTVKEKTWIFGGASLITFGQDYMVNWNAGGVPAINVKGVGNIFLKYAKNKIFWENVLDVNYGIQRNFETKINTKTDDKLEFNTNFGYLIGKNWNLGALVKYQTQMTQGYKNDTILTSNFMTPGYLITSLGIEYKRPMWSFFISPITGKTTFKTDNRFYPINSFAVDSGKKVHIGVGAFMKVAYKYDIHPKIHLDTKLELFYDYIKQPYYQADNNSLNLDVNFEMRWNFMITKWLMATLYTAIIYDYDIRFAVYQADGVTPKLGYDGKPMTTDHVQFKENFGLSFTYNFKVPNKEKK